VYCVNGDTKGAAEAAPSAVSKLHYTELAGLVKHLSELLDIETVRLTGGEPLLYHDLIPLIEALKANGTKHIKMTTNAYMLARKAQELANAGVNDINVSLDALDRDIIKVITKGDYVDSILEGIDAAINAGVRVKLNAVIMRGINENQIIPLLEYAINKKVGLRYLELMRMGHFYSGRFDEYFFPQEAILDTIRTKYPVKSDAVRDPSATAKMWTLENGYKFGIIANESEPFCSDCDRLRLDNTGHIYGCLSEEKSEYIADIADDKNALTEKLMEALKHKQPLKFKGSPLTMISIGG
jgi:cyclic pyranopterin phosphate synthase